VLKTAGLGLAFFATGLLLIGLSIPLMRRKVRPNVLYGFRTPSTLKDERLWYEVNARTGMDLLVVGIGLLAITAVYAFGLLLEPAFVVTAVTWLIAGLIWSTVHGFAIIGRSRR